MTAAEVNISKANKVWRKRTELWIENEERNIKAQLAMIKHAREQIRLTKQALAADAKFNKK